MSSTPRKIVLGADAKFSCAVKLIDVHNTIVNSEDIDFEIDASKVYWISPFTACWFAALKDECDSLDKKIHVIEPERDNAIHQWRNLGISRYLGLSRELVPIEGLPAVEVTRLNQPNYPFAGKVMRILSDTLSPVENFHKALHFAIRETIENCFEHGETDHCYVCAYSVKTKNRVRLCIYDTGIGIPDSLRSNPKWKTISDDIDAVKRSTEYGVSSKTEDRGIGLYILKDFTEKNKGELSILSGKAQINLAGRTKDIRLLDQFHGTIVKLALHSRRDFYYIDAGSWETL